MGWMTCLGNCIICSSPFVFNPNRVPSIRVRGVREPICKDCVERANVKRKENGLEPITPHPLAYEGEEVP